MTKLDDEQKEAVKELIDCYLYMTNRPIISTTQGAADYCWEETVNTINRGAELKQKLGLEDE
jgi:hypothetical protein